MSGWGNGTLAWCRRVENQRAIFCRRCGRGAWPRSCTGSIRLREPARCGPSSAPQQPRLTGGRGGEPAELRREVELRRASEQSDRDGSRHRAGVPAAAPAVPRSLAFAHTLARRRTGCRRPRRDAANARPRSATTDVSATVDPCPDAASDTPGDPQPHASTDRPSANTDSSAGRMFNRRGATNTRDRKACPARVCDRC